MTSHEILAPEVIWLLRYKLLKLSIGALVQLQTMTSACGIMEKRGCPCMGEVNLLIKPERMGWLQFGEPSS